MGLAGSRNIFEAVRQVMYEPLHQNSYVVVDLKGSRPPYDRVLGWFGQQNLGL